MLRFVRPLLGFVAYSGTGKTTLLERLIPELRRRGLRVALIKHTHHAFDIDQPGKDSYRLRKAGAQQVMVASRQRWALITEQAEQQPEPQLPELLTHLDAANLDLVLVEGFKHEAYPKIELRRELLAKPPLHVADPHIIAIATDQPQVVRSDRPVLDINNPEEIIDFILTKVIGAR